MLRNHQNIPKVFFLNFYLFSSLSDTGKSKKKKCLLQISEIGGGLKSKPPPLKGLRDFILVFNNVSKNKDEERLNVETMLS